jgi:NAD(P)-dependent dehydrogenase (short-subunit alcohol dehydrogenase family)
MPGRLSGKVAVVTGGAGGIGRETARRFAQEDARVCVVDLADEPGSEAAEEIGGLYVHADVTDPEDVQNVYAETVERFGGIDVLFNNAGISPPDDDSILDTGLDAWQRVQDVNLKSVYLCCKYGIPHLLERGGGSIINTASFVAVMGAATSQISYTASTGGGLALSSSPKTPKKRSAGSCTCRWAGSRRPRRSPTPCSSWPPTRPPTSTPRPSWLTAASPGHTLHRSRRW